MKRLILVIALSSLAMIVPMSAAGWPLDGEWTPFTRAGSPLVDAPTDAGTGPTEIVGDATFPAAYYGIGWGGSRWGVRIRVDEDPREVSGDLRAFTWGVLFDTDGDFTDYEYLMVVDGGGAADMVTLWENTVPSGQGTPSDPAETEVASYLVDSFYGRVTTADSSFNGTQDFFVEFQLPTTDFFGLGIDWERPESFWIGASNTPDAIATDLAGHDGPIGPDVLSGTVLDPIFRSYAPPTGLGVEPYTGSMSRPIARFERLIGGDTSPTEATLMLINHSSSPIPFGASADQNWLSVTPESGNLPAMASVSVSMTLSSEASLLEVGHYQAEVALLNVMDSDGDTLRGVTLTVHECEDDGGCAEAMRPLCDTDETPMVCVGCFSDADCDDDDSCTGLERCGDDLLCVEGKALDCEDGDVCNGVEACDAILGCIEGSPLDCDDDNACTADSCSPETGCLNEDISATCDDSDACTADSCSPETGCLNEDISATCDDSDACTADSCSPETGCLNEDISATCDDDNPCTIDSCLPESGCFNDGEAGICNEEDICAEDTCGSAEDITPNDLRDGEEGEADTRPGDEDSSEGSCGCQNVSRDAGGNTSPALVFFALVTLLGASRARGASSTL